MPTWTEGRVTLLGDACHSMLPMMAQGAVMALEDGLVLGRCVKKYGVEPEALQRDEAARAGLSRAEGGEFHARLTVLRQRLLDGGQFFGRQRLQG